ncbi:peptide-methionine (S)-S-oxide reductase MsrA [Haliscomenobacter sp.]|uniref:peptide-methionine (S)-S-oxide reductase MsrA n=1 Tax=Haliscomenobacter sp. TaxID=2717303 RepID=UPI00359430F4
MKNKLFALSLGFLFFASACQNQARINAQTKDMKTDKIATTDKESITLAGGCFWCVEAIYQDVEGVYSTVSGYSGGSDIDANYKAVCSGMTGHAEVVQVTFNPNIIALEDILRIFWSTHDPTTLNRQGADVGPQYRSAIFYQDDRQKTIAEKSIKEVASTLWDDPIVTTLEPLLDFYPAEDYHQDYYTLVGSRNSYCTFVITPKVTKFRKEFADKLKKKN